MPTYIPPADAGRVLVFPGRGGLPADGLPVGGLDILEVLRSCFVVYLLHRTVEYHQRVPEENKIRCTKLSAHSKNILQRVVGAYTIHTDTHTTFWATKAHRYQLRRAPST